MIYEVGMLVKHFKGEDLLKKNIYEIVALGVNGSDINESKIEYTGDGNLKTATNLVVYKNIFQEGKTFCREYEDISSELSLEKQSEFGQTIKVQPLTEEESAVVRSEEFINKKIDAVRRKYEHQ